jgi:hypothetical protein
MGSILQYKFGKKRNWGHLQTGSHVDYQTASSDEARSFWGCDGAGDGCSISRNARRSAKRIVSLSDERA